MYDGKTQLNLKLLNKVKKVILKTPRRFDMEFFVCVTDVFSERYRGEVAGTMCNTTACIAGWAVLLTVKPRTKNLEYTSELYSLLTKVAEKKNLWKNPDDERLDVAGFAEKLLGLPDSSLFFTSAWPGRLAAKSRFAGVEEEARVACEAIDAIIAGNGFFDESYEKTFRLQEAQEANDAE